MHPPDPAAERNTGSQATESSPRRTLALRCLRRSRIPPVNCPTCHAANEAPSSGAPFFCSKCHGIVDPTGAISAPISRPRTVDEMPGDTATYVSRYGTKMPRDAVGPGMRFHVAGSASIGYGLAALAALVVGGVLAWLSDHVLRVPLLYPFLLGWIVKHALAAGSGGGTPDRGPLSLLLMIAICAGATVGTRFMEYRTAADAKDDHYLAVFGGFPVADPKMAITKLKWADPDRDGKVVISADGSTVSIDEEEERLQAVATAAGNGVTASEPYDLELIASVSRPGFRGHLLHVAKYGDTVRLMARKSGGWPLPGFAVLLLWFVEFVILALAACSRVE